ncbi:hypothetical protein HK101_010454 [Irineochytrium annulatum]|nr:hypothetical protein HK101_010454 [Irineochytrium annulatum]
MPSILTTPEQVEVRAQAVERKRVETARRIRGGISEVASKTGMRRLTALHLEANPLSYRDLLDLILYFHDAHQVSDAQCALWCSHLGLPAPGFRSQRRLLSWARRMVEDDLMLAMDEETPITALTDLELLEALEERGFINMHTMSREEKVKSPIAHCKFTVLVVTGYELSKGRQSVGANMDLSAKQLTGIASMIICARAMDVSADIGLR